MSKYLVLLRGINVGGKNKIRMADLKSVLSEHGYLDVATYIASGNVILESEKSEKMIQSEIENLLSQNFHLDSDLIKVFIFTPEQIHKVVANKPVGFGEQPDMYHSDVIFLRDISLDEAQKAFRPREGVDEIWSKNGVIYSQRLSAQRTKSRLSRIASTSQYDFMTIRNWNTVNKLRELLNKGD